jgi:hypothetical protein
MVKIIFFIIILFSHSVVIGQGWKRIESPYSLSWSPEEEGFEESYFWSIDSGFAGSSVTVDGGMSWLGVKLPEVRADHSYSTTRRNFFAVGDNHYVTLSTALTISGPDYFQDWSYSPVLHYTRTGDANWSKDSSLVGCVGGDRLRFKDAQNGFAYLGKRGCGEGPSDMIGMPYLAFSTNGGAHWRNTFDGFLSGKDYALLFEFKNGDFIDDRAFIFSSDTGLYILRLTDTLKLETVVRSLNDQHYDRGHDMIACITDSLILSQSNNQLMRSDDQGKSWSVVIDSCIVRDISFASDSVIYAIVKKDGWASIYKSVDRGLSWRAQLLASNTELISISAASDSVAYVFGTNGVAYKTTDGGGTELSVRSRVSDLDSISIFPNPATTEVSIVTSLFKDQEVNIYDQLGREVFSYLIDTELEALPISIQTLPNGCYTIKIGAKSARIIVTH